MTQAGSTIGPYEIVEQVGSGGMATVFKAYQPKLDRHVAIKVMHKMFQDERDFLARFEREARIVAQLDHPNIVPIYDYDEHEGQPYLVMKYVEGRTLKSHSEDSPLTLDEVKSVMRAVCDALTYAHRKGVLHRDMKPSNIIIDEHGMPYLTDFGLARIAKQGESTLSVDAMLGTPHYISPEQAQGSSDDLDARTDVYATGIILYELMTGRLPFTGDSAYAIIHKQINAAPPQPSKLNPELPPELDRVLLRALEKEPSERYDTPTDLMNAFSNALSSTGLSELDNGRVEQAARLGDMISQQTPGGGSYHSLTLSDRGKLSVIVPSLPHAKANYHPQFNEWFDLAIERLRYTIDDIIRQLRGRSLQEHVSAAYEDIRGEVNQYTPGKAGQREESQAYAGGHTARAGRRKQQASAGDYAAAQHPQQPQAIPGLDDDSIRERAQKRLLLRRSFLIHAIVYVVVMPVLFTVQGQGQAAMLETFRSAAFIAENGQAIADAFTPLAEIPWALVVAFLWGSGLLSHALKLYSNTGDRLMARHAQVEREMQSLYGPTWRQTADASEFQVVRRDIDQREERRVDLYTHILNAMMLIIAGYLALPTLEGVIANIVFIEEGAALPVQNWANIWAILMLVGLLIRVAVTTVTGFAGRESRERAMQREIMREKGLSGLYQQEATGQAEAKAKRQADGVRLTEDGEFTDSFANEVDRGLDEGRH